MLNKLLKISAIVVLLMTGFSVSYYLLFTGTEKKPVANAEVTKKDPEAELRKRFKDFSDMISVDLCQEAYNEFITSGSGERKGYQGFFAHCKFRNERWRNISIQTAFFSGNERADIQYSYDDIGVLDTTTAEYKKCFELDAFFMSCIERSPKKTEKMESIETWLFQDGKWKRDY